MSLPTRLRFPPTIERATASTLSSPPPLDRASGWTTSTPRAREASDERGTDAAVNSTENTYPLWQTPFSAIITPQTDDVAGTYFIGEKDSAFCHIGSTNDLSRQLSILQESNPRQLEIWRFIPARDRRSAEELEARIHAMLFDYNVSSGQHAAHLPRSKWYRLSVQCVEMIYRTMGCLLELIPTAFFDDSDSDDSEEDNAREADAYIASRNAVGGDKTRDGVGTQPSSKRQRIY